MKFIATSWPQVEYQGRVLTDAGATNRMLSFYYLRDLPPDFLEQYMAQGYVEKPRRRKLKRKAPRREPGHFTFQKKPTRT